MVNGAKMYLLGKLPIKFKLSDRKTNNKVQKLACVYGMEINQRTQHSGTPLTTSIISEGAAPTKDIRPHKLNTTILPL